MVYLPTWLERNVGFSSNQIATLFLVGGVANVLTGPQAGRMSDRIGRKLIVLLSCLGLLLVMPVTTVAVRSIWIAFPLFFLVMVLVAMRVSPFYARLGYGSHTVVGAVSVLGMGLIVWFMVPEPPTQSARGD